MKRSIISSTYFSFTLLAMLMLCSSGCAFRVVKPEPLVVGTVEDGNLRVIEYPNYVVVHDSRSFWDAHQIKSNIFGLTEIEIVRIVDATIDCATPGPENRPLEVSIEWIKNSYAQLPDCAPVRIIGGLFYALGIEKTSVLNGINGTILTPTDPTLIYLTDWLQDTLGELNTAGGYLIPKTDKIIPRKVTTPVNDCVDWTQNGIIGVYIYVVKQINIGVDKAIDGGENAWGAVVGIIVR